MAGQTVDAEQRALDSFREVYTVKQPGVRSLRQTR